MQQEVSSRAKVAGNLFSGNQSPQGQSIMLREAGTTVTTSNKGLTSSSVLSVTYEDQGSAAGYEDYGNTPSSGSRDYADPNGGTTPISVAG